MKIKSTLSLILCIGVLLCGNVFAEENAKIEPRYVPCSNCAQGRISESTEYGAWILDRWVLSCEHGFPKGTDKFYHRDIFTVYDCNYCNYHASIKTDVELRVECFGKDRSIA